MNLKTSLLIWQLSLLVLYTHAKEILIFGGNGFIGSTTVDKILKNEPDASITIVSRGNWYWDSSNRIKPKVKRTIRCDREYEIEKCEELLQFISETEIFDVVIDFSAYSAAAVKDASKVLKHKVKLYILISTDSVYDICDKNHNEPSQEDDCVIPETEEQKDQIYNFDTYGHRKMQSEDALVSQRLQDGGYEFIIIRLPDVIGPRDGTYRWWIYQIWAKVAKDLPDKTIRIPYFLDKYAMSFVYVEDVANIIANLFDAPPQVRDQVINLAWPETFTLEDVLRAIQTELGVDNEIVVDESRDNQFYLYPSVRKGPIDVSKAQSILGWEPTPWTDVVKATVEFYENAMKSEEFLTQRDEIIQVMSHSMYEANIEKMKALYSAIEKNYKIDLKNFHAAHDEL